jgi:hypothetical protein
MSTNLSLPALSGGQANPETTVNDANGAIDAAITETLVVDLTVDETLSSADYCSAIRFSITPTGSAKTLTLPAVKRLVYISNDGTIDCTIAKGSTTISLAHGDGGFFYTDGTTNGLLQLSAGAGGGGGSTDFDVVTFVPGVLVNSQLCMRILVGRAFTWPSGLTGSVFSSGVAATASTTLTIKQNGTSIGTLVWAASGTTPTVTFSSSVTFAIDDVITIEAPSSADATLADVSLTFLGTK